MNPLVKATSLVVALARGLGVELNPKVAATPIGAGVAAAVLAVLAATSVHVAPVDQDVLAVTFTIVAAFLHPEDGS